VTSACDSPKESHWENFPSLESHVTSALQNEANETVSLQSTQHGKRNEQLNDTKSRHQPQYEQSNKTMSEESKTSDSDYVHMSDTRPSAFTAPNAFLDDPTLSQEDRDLRLAIALQQQENAAVYDAHKKRHDAALAANANRTGRSGVHSRLAQIRKKDHGMLSVPDAYATKNAYKRGDHVVTTEEYIQPNPNATPQEQRDLNLAMELQKVEQSGAGTARLMDKILTEEVQDGKADEMRNARSGKAAFHPTRGKK